MSVSTALQRKAAARKQFLAAATKYEKALKAVLNAETALYSAEAKLDEANLDIGKEYKELGITITTARIQILDFIRSND